MIATLGADAARYLIGPARAARHGAEAAASPACSHRANTCAPASFSTAACDGSSLSAPTTPFGYLPITVTSVNTVAPYTLTPFGLSLGLTESDVDDCCTHNSFSAVGGLAVVDFDQNGIATTLAGNVRVGDGGLLGVPEPGTWALMVLGFGGVGAVIRRRRSDPAFA